MKNVVLGSIALALLSVSAHATAADSCRNIFEFNSNARASNISSDRDLKNPDRAARREALKSVSAFKNYFSEIRAQLFERGYVVDTAELALLSEEHLLIMGPPGNAKSMLADKILGNIHEANGKSSYFRLQMTPETTLSETHGPLDFKTLNDTGRYIRLLEEGMLLSRNVFVDEIFDARSNAQRNILGMLNERAHAQGTHITPGKIETAFAATNKYISEVYEKAGDDGPKAVLDRFAFSVFIPGEFESTSSYTALIKGAKKNQRPIPELTFDQIDKLRALVPQVEIPDSVAVFLSVLSTRIKAETEALEQSSIKNFKERLKNGEEPGIPYRSTKYHSPRTLGKAAGVLKALVVQDWIKKGGKRKLEANLDDIKALEGFFTLNGPSEAFIKSTVERTSNPHERAQLMAILQERQIFEKYYRELLDEVNQVLVHFALHDVQAEVQLAQTESQREAAVKKILGFMIALEDESSANTLHASRTGKDIGIELIRDQYRQLLAQVTGGKENASKVLNQLEQERKNIIADKMRHEQEARLAQEKALKAETDRQAMEKARAEAELRKQKEHQEKLIATLGTKTSVWSSKMIVSDHKMVRIAYHPETHKLAVIDLQSSMLKTINLEPSKPITSSDLMIETTTMFPGQIADSMHFLDADHLVFTDPSGQAVSVLNLKTSEQKEILISRVAGAKIAYDQNSKELYTFDRMGLLTKGSLDGGAREKHQVKFATTELESKFNNNVKNRASTGPLALSKDGKFLTFMDMYHNEQYVIDLQKKEIVSSAVVYGSNVNSETIGAGYVVGINQKFVVRDETKSPAVFKVISDPSNTIRTVQAAVNGLKWLPGTDFVLLGGNQGLQLWNSTDNSRITVKTDGITSGNIFTPIVLPDGRIFVLAYEGNSWRAHILQ